MHLAKTLTILCVFSISVSVFVETTEVEDEPINTWQKFKVKTLKYYTFYLIFNILGSF